MQVTFQKQDIRVLRKDRMLVDMHFHSRYSYDCNTSVESIIKRCKELGVGVALTDHNSIGGVLAAHRIEPDVIKPAVEICTIEGKEIIPYFYTVEDLKSFFDSVVQPKLRIKTSLQTNSTRLRMADLLDALRREDCVVALPHPFAMPPRRSYSYFMKPINRAMLERIDAFEAINQTMLHKQNLAAAGWAMQHGKSIVGGSDGHSLRHLGSAFTAAQARDWPEFLARIRAKQADVIGEERTLRHQVMCATGIITEKARVLRNLRKTDLFD